MAKNWAVSFSLRANTRECKSRISCQLLGILIASYQTLYTLFKFVSNLYYCIGLSTKKWALIRICYESGTAINTE